MLKSSKNSPVCPPRPEPFLFQEARCGFLIKHRAGRFSKAKKCTIDPRKIARALGRSERLGQLEDVMKVAQGLLPRRAVMTGLGILVAIAALGDPKLATAQQRPLKKVNIVVATPVLNVTYSQLTLP